MYFEKNLKQSIDWQHVDKELYLQGMECSLIDALEIKTLLKQAPTDDINNRIIIIKGLEKAYEYEGYVVSKSKADKLEVKQDKLQKEK